MDYGPSDYTDDRVRGLEMRIEQLEQRLAAAPDGSGTPPIVPTPVRSCIADSR